MIALFGLLSLRGKAGGLPPTPASASVPGPFDS